MNRRYWIVKIVRNGFEFPVFLYGTENAMQDYCLSEFGCITSCSGATDDEVAAGKLLKMKFYMV